MSIQTLNNPRYASLICSLLVTGAVVLGAVSSEQNPLPDELVAASGLPQEMPKPGPEHAWLAKQIGTWETKHQLRFGPNTPWIKYTGTVKTKSSCGGFWITTVTESTILGMPIEGQQQLGFDQHKKEFVATWIDSFADYLVVYTGTLSDDKKVLTLSGSVRDPNNLDKGIPMKMVVTMKSDDELATQMFVPGPDGKDYGNMEIEHKRKK